MKEYRIQSRSDYTNNEWAGAIAPPGIPYRWTHRSIEEAREAMADLIKRWEEYKLPADRERITEFRIIWREVSEWEPMK